VRVQERGGRQRKRRGARHAHAGSSVRPHDSGRSGARHHPTPTHTTPHKAQTDDAPSGTTTRAPRPPPPWCRPTAGTCCSTAYLSDGGEIAQPRSCTACRRGGEAGTPRVCLSQRTESQRVGRRAQSGRAHPRVRRSPAPPSLGSPARSFARPPGAQVCTRPPTPLQGCRACAHRGQRAHLAVVGRAFGVGRRGCVALHSCLASAGCGRHSCPGCLTEWTSGKETAPPSAPKFAAFWCDATNLRSWHEIGRLFDFDDGRRPQPTLNTRLLSRAPRPRALLRPAAWPAEAARAALAPAAPCLWSCLSPSSLWTRCGRGSRRKISRWSL
jgi:hypothetical protein